jgi:hypothetical protein
MSFWRDVILVTAVVLILNAIVGNLPDIDSNELFVRIIAVLTCATALGFMWWYRKGDK